MLDIWGTGVSRRPGKRYAERRRSSLYEGHGCNIGDIQDHRGTNIPDIYRSVDHRRGRRESVVVVVVYLVLSMSPCGPEHWLHRLLPNFGCCLVVCDESRRSSVIAVDW